MDLLHKAKNLTVERSSIYYGIRRYWCDILVTLLLATGTGYASFWGAQILDPSGDSLNSVFDVWFGADSPRVLEDMTNRRGDHQRLKVHPLFSLITFPPVFVLRKALDLETITAVRLFTAAIAACWIIALFVLLRLVLGRRIDAMLFSILGAVSAGAMFFFVVPETYPLGSLSILFGLCFAAIVQSRKLSPLWYVFTNAVTLSMTISNWMVGIFTTFIHQPWKRFFQIAGGALSLVGVLWAIQKYFFPSAGFFLDVRKEKSYLLMASSGGPVKAVQSFLFHSVVMPAIQVIDDPDLFHQKYQPDWQLLLTQPSLPGSGSLWGHIAIFLWSALLILGLWALFSARTNRKFRLVLGLSLLGQLTLHLVYGDETFLFSLHFVPLLVVLAALSTLTRLRLLALLLTGGLILTAGINNVSLFNQAVAFAHRSGSPRQQVQTQKGLRPADFWARGTGHVVLAMPGSLETNKAYHEPGGSFSPAVGSFGLAVWVTDAAGNPQFTSDTVPLDQVRQQLQWVDGQTLPTIATETKAYKLQYTATQAGRWTLKLKPQLQANTKLSIAIRSVGPAGGAIQSLRWRNQRLQINDRWSITIDPAPQAVYLGEERPGWKTERSTATAWQGASGWGYARFEFPDDGDINLVIEDADFQPAIALARETRSTLTLNLPDPQFADSLNAQVAHIMMGLVRRETRPGEPTNYPLAWLRDGAYEVVALARAGQLDVAKELSVDLAEHDFFGGFGAEADAPGLAIWALEAVARQWQQPDYDRWLWQHVRRKAELISEMLRADQPVRHPAIGAVVPKQEGDPNLDLVAQSAQNGLIVGRMDNHYPLLFVNAVSYRGLLDAAALADRVNQPAEAKRWRQQAVALQQAWEKALKPPELDNERTYISSLWPTWIGAAQTEVLRQGLETRWATLRDAQGNFRSTPLWTYFDVAEAHQWLLLNQPERVWTTLQWFWQHQASPGLYTWWEGNGEENTFERWERVRGWVKPQHVTPHYWTAAEMLLLQLEMLAYADQAASDPTVVIGAGVPAVWLDRPIAVQGLPIQSGQVDWRWDGQQLHVVLRGDRAKVQLGSAFPAGTPVQVEYAS